jgi:hypothetical protein
MINRILKGASLLSGMALLILAIALLKGEPNISASATQAAETEADHSAMSVEDFIVDRATLKGVVKVQGSPACIAGQLCYLYGDPMTSFVMFDPKDLPRDDRRHLLGCNPFSSPCKMILTGIPDPSNPIASVRAKSVEWE